MAGEAAKREAGCVVEARGGGSCRWPAVVFFFFFFNQIL